MYKKTSASPEFSVLTAAGWQKLRPNAHFAIQHTAKEKKLELRGLARISLKSVTLCKKHEKMKDGK